MPLKNHLKITLFTFVLVACSSSDSFEIDFNDPETTLEYADQYAQAMIESENYSAAEEAYMWINQKNPTVFHKTYHLKYIDLFGAQGRYEKQLDEYNKIFVSDSIDNSEFVPHFYNSIGMSYYERSKIPLISGQLDSTLLKLAIDNFVKCYAYRLYKDQEIQAASRYFAGLSYSKMGNFDKSLEMFEFIVDSMRGTSVHPKAFFKEKDYQDYNDIVVSTEMMRQYDEAYQFVKTQADKQELQDKSDELSRQPDVDTTVVKIEPDTTQNISEELPAAEDELPGIIVTETDSVSLPEPVTLESDSTNVDDSDDNN